MIFHTNFFEFFKFFYPLRKYHICFPLQKLNMMAIMDMTGAMSVYSGAAFVGKLHIPSHAPSYVLSNFYGRESASSMMMSMQSPFPRRSSLISPSKSSTPDVLKFDEGVHLLSPVGAGVSGTGMNVMDGSLTDMGGTMSLKNAVANKLILEHGDANYFQISLPTLKASPLGKCFFTLGSEMLRYCECTLLCWRKQIRDFVDENSDYFIENAGKVYNSCF